MNACIPCKCARDTRPCILPSGTDHTRGRTTKANIVTRGPAVLMASSSPYGPPETEKKMSAASDKTPILWSFLPGAAAIPAWGSVPVAKEEAGEEPAVVDGVVPGVDT